MRMRELATRAVTERIGYAVEINALWYNAICFTLKLAAANNDKTFVNKWGNWPEKFRDSFKSISGMIQKPTWQIVHLMTIRIGRSGQI